MNFWGIAAIFFWSFAFVAYLFGLFAVIVDLFRDDKLNGWWKALWALFLIFVPFLTVLVYVIARGRGMAERSAARHQPPPENDEDLKAIRAESYSNPTVEIDRAKTLLDAGTISQGEFDAIKNKALGHTF